MKLAAGYTFSDVDGQAGNLVLAQKLHDLIEKATLTEKVSQNDLDDELKSLIGIDAEGNIAIRMDQLSDELQAELGIVEGETELSRTHLSQDLQDLLFIEFDDDTETYMMKIPVSALPDYTLEDLNVELGSGLQYDPDGKVEVVVSAPVLLQTPITVAGNITNITTHQAVFDLSAEVDIPDNVYQIAFEIQGSNASVVTGADSLFFSIGDSTQTIRTWADVTDLITMLQREQLTIDISKAHSDWSCQIDHIKILGYRY